MTFATEYPQQHSPVTAAISKEFTFSSSHQLYGLPEDHPCSRLHGHNYVVRLELQGTTDRTGFVMDYRALSPFKDFLDETMDHRHLNDVVKFNPTAEHLAKHLANYASATLHLPETVTLVKVSISETPKTWATASTVRHIERNL